MQVRRRVGRLRSLQDDQDQGGEAHLWRRRVPGERKSVKRQQMTFFFFFNVLSYSLNASWTEIHRI